MTEIEKTVALVREQHGRARNSRQWKRRLAAFGFAIEPTDDGLMIAKLPRRTVVCPVPQDLLA